MNGQPLRFSRLKLMGRSPAHFAASSQETTSAMSVGTAAHSLILGGRRVVGYAEGKVRRGKEYDAWLADQNPDAIILTANEARDAHGMANAVTSTPDAMRVLEGDREETVYWTDPMVGPCRGTPDVRGRDFLTELKTGETSDPRKFQWQVIEYAYHAQLAWYLDGVYDETQPFVRTAYIVAVESKPPFVVTVFRVGERTIEQGRKLCRLWCERLKVCVDSDSWPGYSSAIVDLELPEQDSQLIFESEDT